MEGPRTDARVAEELQVPKRHAGVWLRRYVEEKLGDLVKHMSALGTEAEMAEEIRVPRGRVRRCLKRLTEEGVAVKLVGRPVRYRSAVSIGPLFDRRD